MKNNQNRLMLRSRRNGRRGSTMVEFALVGTFMIFLLFTTIQLSVIMNAYNTLSQISREAARFAAIHATEQNFDGDKTISGSLQNYLSNVCGGTTIPYGDITATPGYLDNNTPAQFHATSSYTDSHRAIGQPISVQITYDMSKKITMTGLSAIWTHTTAFQKPVTKYGTMIIEKK